MQQMTILNLTDLLYSCLVSGHPSSLLIEGIISDEEQDPNFQDLQRLLAGNEYYSHEVMKLIATQIITIFMAIAEDPRLDKIRQSNLISFKESMYVHH